MLLICNPNSWTPSKYYDDETQLIWVQSFPIFKKLYNNKIKQTSNVKYAIHKDVYKAFLLQYKTNKKTRKINRNNI